MGIAGLLLAFLMFCAHAASIFFPRRLLIKGASGLCDVHISTDPFLKHMANCNCQYVFFNGLKPHCRTLAGWDGPKSLKASRCTCRKCWRTLRVFASWKENCAGTSCSWDVKNALSLTPLPAKTKKEDDHTVTFDLAGVFQLLPENYFVLMWGVALF